PGSGKSALAAEAIRELRANGGAVVIDADRMREENPRYKQLSREDPQHAADRTQKEAGEWATRLTLAAVENRRNLVVDGTMRSPENIRDLTTRLKEQGYEVEARVLAVNPETSVTRARLRFEEQVAERGTGRFVNKEQHDNAYNGMVESVRALERDK
ncbi:AAA family ATPase, partial [Streptococcus suis]